MFLVGGMDSNRVTLKSTFRHDIANNKWESMPELKQARDRASACSLGGKVYVFAGYGWNMCLNSIEKLNNPNLPKDQASWQLIEPPKDILSPHSYAIVAPLNKTEIVILGGFDDKNYPHNNIVLFNIRSERCKKVANKEPFKFLAQEN